MAKRYGIIFFASAIVMISSLVGYGIYVNSASNAHIAKMTAAQYFRVGGAKTGYRELSPVLELATVNLTAAKVEDIHFQIDGTLTRVMVKTGDRIRKGQLLGEVVNAELPSMIKQAEGKVHSIEANIAKLQKSTKQNEDLANAGIIPRQQYEESLDALAAANAELDIGRSSLEQLSPRLAEQQIVAPFDGNILKIYQAQGCAVQPGEPLAMVGDLSSLYMHINMPEDVMKQLSNASGNIKFTVKERELIDKVYASSVKGNEAIGDKDFTVEIMQVAPSMSVPAQYRSVVFKIDNSKGMLKPATYYQTKIYGTNKQRVLAVPLEALFGEEEKSVFVVTPENLLEQRPIRIGIQDNEYIEVRSGLAEGDTVVISGHESGLYAGMKVRLTSESPESIHNEKKEGGLREWIIRLADYFSKKH